MKSKISNIFSDIHPLYKKLLSIFFIIIVIYVMGTIGFLLLDSRYSFLEAFFMTVITVSTVGFGEVKPIDQPETMIFTIFLIVMGIGFLGYSVSTLISFVVEGKIKNTFRDHKMQKQIAKMKNHIIICGHGRLGRHAAMEFDKKKFPYVVIEKVESVTDKLKELGIPCINGSAEYDDTLIQAGIERAHGLIAALTDDTDNLFVTLTARRLNPDLYIISRVEFENSGIKLLSAGANKVMSPAKLAGRRMASLLVNPEVVNFLDVVLESKDLDLSMQEMKIVEDSDMDGVQIREANIPFELKVIGLRDISGKIKVNPLSSENLKAGMTLMILGENYKINEFKNQHKLV
ncbi:potassium channel family protein [candidate division KSB1 bacterium]